MLLYADTGTTQYQRRDYTWGYEIWAVSAVAPYSALVRTVWYF